MCAEAVWWRCHRSLIADYLKARGVEVLHVLGANKVEPHPYTSAARIVNGELSYAAQLKERRLGRPANVARASSLARFRVQSSKRDACTTYRGSVTRPRNKQTPLGTC